LSERSELIGEGCGPDEPWQARHRGPAPTSASLEKLLDALWDKRPGDTVNAMIRDALAEDGPPVTDERIAAELANGIRPPDPCRAPPRRGQDEVLGERNLASLLGKPEIIQGDVQARADRSW
jgi:hypothetical protein